jgi:predicted transcriptional regulator
MPLRNYIINDVKPLLLSGKVADLQMLFNQLTYSHIPVKNDDGIYLGCISENDAHCFESDKPLADCTYAIEGFFVRHTATWLNVLEVFAENNANIMPVLDTDNNYLGYYELNDVINVFNETPFLSEVGGILIVEKGLQDYSMSEITQIIEANNGKVLGAFLSKIERDVVQITVKIANASLNEVIQSFRRYSYNIISETEGDVFIENLKERSDYLNKYLNM